MPNTGQNDRRKVTRREKSRRKDDIRTIKIDRKVGKGQEVTIGHETAPEMKNKSAWSWYEEFSFKWSETFITMKKGKTPKKGE